MAAFVPADMGQLVVPTNGVRKTAASSRTVLQRKAHSARPSCRVKMMATVIDVTGQIVPLDLDYMKEELDNPLKEIQETICSFMNRDHLGDLLQYVHNFSDMLTEEAMEEVTQVELFQVDQYGLSIEIVLCGKEDERCVCLRPKVPWRGENNEERRCDTVDDVLFCLGEMSQRCGLPAP
ncbi:hypothetical protein FVE85_6513 [Porphyridium purpureum]|uniref:Uncharacterized protein n=1 Tax=Porphyridium purpureum TaxID=35688 RepID=A0A5J4Z6U4_PORPP|nr:hypothetical protein FVE85_6513 [Porphyridium purpureum]|eukprot:POR5665..scf295_1